MASLVVDWSNVVDVEVDGDAGVVSLVMVHPWVVHAEYSFIVLSSPGHLPLLELLVDLLLIPLSKTSHKP